MNLFHNKKRKRYWIMERDDGKLYLISPSGKPVETFGNNTIGRPQAEQWRDNLNAKLDIEQELAEQEEIEKLSTLEQDEDVAFALFVGIGIGTVLGASIVLLAFWLL